jgi:hypothetical protein
VVSVLLESEWCVDGVCVCGVPVWGTGVCVCVCGVPVCVCVCVGYRCVDGVCGVPVCRRCVWGTGV